MLVLSEYPFGQSDSDFTVRTSITYLIDGVSYTINHGMIYEQSRYWHHFESRSGGRPIAFSFSLRHIATQPVLKVWGRYELPCGLMRSSS